jgi:AcrR family transcriptional regulator
MSMPSSPVVKRAVQVRSQETRKRFIKAVLKLAKKNPMHMVTSKNICIEVGTAWGSAQHLFGSKEFLFVESIRYASSEFLKLCEKELLRDNYTRDDLQALIVFLWRAANNSSAILNHEIAIACLHDAAATTESREIISNVTAATAKLVISTAKKLYPDASQQSLMDILLLVETFFTGLHFRRNFTRSQVTEEKLKTMANLWRLALIDITD